MNAFQHGVKLLFKDALEQLLFRKALVAGNSIKEGVNACILGIPLPCNIDARLKWLLLTERG